MGHRVFVTSLINQHYLSKLKEHMEVELNPMNRQLTQSEIMQFAKDKDALLCTVSDEINSEVMDACPRLKIISNYGVGYNNIDLEAATSSGVIVTNTPGVLTDATADLTWALLLDVAAVCRKETGWSGSGNGRDGNPGFCWGRR